MKKPTSCLTAAAVAAGVLVVAAPPVAQARPQAHPQPAQSSISWRECRDPALVVAGADCATVKVPLDHDRPDGRQISIAVSRVEHTSTDHQGALLVNPGGPGGPGLQYAGLGDFLPDAVSGKYDWIGFDPRGVGASRPTVRCQKRYFDYDRPDYDTSTKRSERRWRERTRGYAKACAKKNGDLLRHMRTEDVARDMDLIRSALGQPRISFYGFSYGTYLGQVYATLFPDRVHRMVMDANVDPSKAWYRANLAQTKAFDANMKRWFRWVADHHDFYGLGRTGKQVRRAWYAERRALERTPAGGRIGPSEWTDTFLYAGYYTSTWIELADAWYSWKKQRDWRPLRDEYAAFNSPRDDNGYAVYAAVSCTDAPWPKKWKKWRKDARRLDRKSPFAAWANTWFNAPCHAWKVRPGKRVKVKGSNVPMLLVNERFDAATPYKGALAVRKLFPSSSLVKVRRGTTHAGSLGGNRCVDGAVADFLRDGTRPARKAGRGADLSCARTPLPNPRHGFGVRGFARGSAAGPAGALAR